MAERGKGFGIDSPSFPHRAAAGAGNAKMVIFIAARRVYFHKGTNKIAKTGKWNVANEKHKLAAQGQGVD